MKKIILVTNLIFISIFLLAPNPSCPAIQGKVYNNGEPSSFTKVTLASCEDTTFLIEIRTGINGEYTFTRDEVTKPGVYYVTATSPTGYDCAFVIYNATIPVTVEDLELTEKVYCECLP